MSQDGAGRNHIEARLPIAFSDDGTVPDWVMYMPGGTHEITATSKGKPKTLTVTVDRETASALQNDLVALKAGKQKPFLDFDHKREGASAWPQEFAWRDRPEPGVWCRVEWSQAGIDAVKGKVYRSFSPSFFEEDGKVVGAALCMGSLVNDPAFEAMAPIWSRRVQQTPNEGTEMSASNTELAALNSRIVELEQRNAELAAQAADEESKAAIEAAKAEADASKAEIARLKEELDARARRDADAVVASAVSRGVIPPKDEEGQKKWRDLIIADSKNAELLAKMPGKVALTSPKLTSTRSQVQLVQADTNDILRAYINAGTPREKGLIYANELSKRINAGENVMARWDRNQVDAANSNGTVANALVSQRVLELVVSKRPMLSGVVTDFSDEVKSKGDTTTTRTIGLPTAQNFGTTESYTADTDVVVTLDLFKEVRYAFSAAEIVGTSRNLIAERSEALAIALGNSMVDAMAALITETNFGTSNQTIQATAGIDFSTLVAINQAMNTAGVPDMGRFGWVNAAVAAALANDQLVTEYIDKSPIANAYARWRNIKGFENVWEYPALPANSINLTGFFASRSALIVAARIPRNPSELVGANYPGTMQVVTDPVSGLSVLRNEWIDGSTWSVNSRLVTLYGVDLGQAACGHTLVSAA